MEVLVNVVAGGRKKQRHSWMLNIPSQLLPAGQNAIPKNAAMVSGGWQ
jgi:hypothetical protein